MNSPPLSWLICCSVGWKSSFLLHTSLDLETIQVFGRAISRRFNPVREYLIGLENDQNIQPLEIDSLAYRYLQVESELSNAMLASCLVGAVARALDNGCQMDYLTCLKGEQGIHKSGFWRTLAGPFFNDTKQDNLKDMSLAIGSSWIYEWPELETMVSRKDQGLLKL